MEKAGILDLSRFAKTRITGPGAEAWLNTMTCQKVPTKDGRIALSPMLDKNGNFKSDMTVTRIKDGEYFCVTASVGKRHDQHWLMENLPADGSVCMEDVTYKMGCLVLAGPRSRRYWPRPATATSPTQPSPSAPARRFTWAGSNAGSTA
jgi:dimethylglycine dehydrogenase